MMGNNRSHKTVLRDMANELAAELVELVKTDQAERGYSEGAREELALRINTLRAATVLSPDLIASIRDVLDNYSDVSDGDDGIANVPNQAMRVLARLEQETGR